MSTITRTLRVPVSFTDTSLPTLTKEPLLSMGSLYLLDPTHPWNPTSPEALTSAGSAIPNLAWEQLSDVLGGGDQSSLASSMYSAGGATKLRETTAKGAPHWAYDPTVALTGNIGSFTIPAGLIDYINANLTHSFYFCMSMMPTTCPTGPDGTRTTRNTWGGLHGTNDTAGLVSFDTNGDLPADGDSHRLFGNRVGAGDDITAIGSPVFRSVAVSGMFAGTEISTGALQSSQANIFQVGRNSNWVAGAQLPASGVLYTAYAEDLTVSGRTPAQVDALAVERHNELFATGGRYANDSFTDPATYFA